MKNGKILTLLVSFFCTFGVIFLVSYHLWTFNNEIFDLYSKLKYLIFMSLLVSLNFTYLSKYEIVVKKRK